MKPITPLQNIELISYQQDHLSITFKNEWYQEDITSLSELILLPTTPVVIQEKNIGADREDIRFSWSKNYFVLNFDYYSQSCWIEGQDNASTECLSALHLALNSAILKQ